ncbi:MAG: hypothetical protein JO165_01600 [Candidatus Eremiobacteraeota bacterium]|nr:hypothetical protein [Candidatus Eremiobacteraeota bacterium]
MFTFSGRLSIALTLAILTGVSGMQSLAGTALAVTATSSAIASLAIQLQFSTLPLGQHMALTVIARDSHGAIITGAYDHPIVLTSSAVHFSPNSLVDAMHAKNVVAMWANGFAGPSAATITATADGHSTTTTLTPQTGFAFYTVGTNPATDVGGFQMKLGTDGNIYYGTVGSGGTDGAIGQFNPVTKVAHEIELHSPTNGVLVSSDGAVWVAGGTSDKLFRVPPHTFSASALQTIVVPTPVPNHAYTPRLLTQDGSGRVWFTDIAGHRALKIPVAGPYVSGSITSHVLPIGLPGTMHIPGRGQGIAFGSDGNLYVLDQANGSVNRVAPSTGATTAQTLTPEQMRLGSSDSSAPRFITKDASGRFFFTQLGSFTTNSVGTIDTFLPGFGISTLRQPNILAGTLPDSIDANGSVVYYANLAANGLGVYSEPNNSSRLYPVSALSEPFFEIPDGVAVLPDATAWFTCYGNATTFQPLCLGHTVYLSGWSVFPGRDVALSGIGNASAQIIGIMERPSVNSGPFTAVSSNTAICRTTSVVDHNFNIIGVASGVCNITVTDSHAVKVSIRVTVPSVTAPRAQRAAPILKP